MPKLRLAQVRKAVVRRGRHSAGNVTGQSIADSLALPARAQVSLSHDGVDHAQVFFQLRKPWVLAGCLGASVLGPEFPSQVEI